VTVRAARNQLALRRDGIDGSLPSGLVYILRRGSVDSSSPHGAAIEGLLQATVNGRSRTRRPIRDVVSARRLRSYK
jgi:hypothetical protein